MPKIIIVDDEEDQEDLIVQKFGNKSFLLGYEFIFAPNGLAALHKIQANPDIEIALIDINMPEMDGLTLLDKIKEINPILRTVILSAYGDMSNIRRAMNLGAFDFVTKPIDMADLEITIRKTIEQVSQLKENEYNFHENLILKQKTTELEMRALRAQMNPHFIFNSLNSINNFILTNDKEQASEYLIKFSKLVRLILENSTLPLISLGQELEALKLYIELEALRFKSRFAYHITLSANLDTTSIKVPPLILQPFVENAIHHGLMPKEGGGQLNITIEEMEHELQLKIEDDGIGRQNVSSIQGNTKAKNKSLGIAVTSERIGFLNNYHTGNSKIEIHDLTDSDGKTAGTEVVIHIPIIV